MNPTCLVLRNEESVLAPKTPVTHVELERLTSPAAEVSSWFGRGRRRRALLWGIVSTILSAIGLIGLAMFEQYNGMLSELRADLKHFNESSGEYVKRDRLQKIREVVKECSREVSASSAARDELQRELRASERQREEMARELQQMRERLAYLEGLRGAGAGAASVPAGDWTDPADEPVHRPPAGSGGK
jgi:hypothetical protein